MNWQPEHGYKYKISHHERRQWIYEALRFYRSNLINPFEAQSVLKLQSSEFRQYEILGGEWSLEIYMLQTTLNSIPSIFTASVRGIQWKACRIPLIGGLTGI